MVLVTRLNEKAIWLSTDPSFKILFSKLSEFFLFWLVWFLVHF